MTTFIFQASMCFTMTFYYLASNVIQAFDFYFVPMVVGSHRINHNPGYRILRMSIESNFCIYDGVFSYEKKETS